MNGLKNVLGKVFALWALIVFVSTLLIVIIIAWVMGVVREPARSRILQHVYQAWMAIFFVVTGVRRIIKGRKHFKRGQAYVVVCNHNSLLDPPLSTPAIPGANKTIAKIEMARIPLFGIVYRRGSVLVDRKNEESRRQSYVKMKEVLAMGLHMCIYPEGTRNKTKEPLQKFHDGAFRLAVETGHSVIPALIFHTAEVLPPRKSFFFWPRRVEMHFLPPVEASGKSTAQLKEEVRSLMTDYYVRHNH